MSEKSSSTWDLEEETEVVKSRVTKRDAHASSIGLGTALEEIEKMQTIVHDYQKNLNALSYKRRDDFQEKIDSLIIFIEQAIEKKLENIKSLKNYDISFDEDNGIIIMNYFIRNRLSLEEEREIADFEVIVLEKINVYRMEFRRIYLR